MSQGEYTTGKYIALAVFTFFLPFAGAWFLLKPTTPHGFQLFGLVWCAIYVVMMLYWSNFVGIPAAVLAGLTLIPIGYNFADVLRARRREDLEAMAEGDSSEFTHRDL